MSEYEPDDSRDVTNTRARAPGEPPRTGPREDQARAAAGQPQAQQQQDEPTEAGGPRDIEGDSPEHPDRMGAFAGEAADGRRQAQQGSGSEQDHGDRWRHKAQAAPSG